MNCKLKLQYDVTFIFILEWPQLKMKKILSIDKYGEQMKLCFTAGRNVDW